MAKNTRIGDIFCVTFNNGTKKYLQYIASDMTQLNSDVIRAFKKSYPVDDDPDPSTIVEDEVDFYAHCVTKWGIELGFWTKVGNIQDVGNLDHILFRSSSDDGDPDIKISKKWWIWKINEDQEYIGNLKGEYRNAEIGSVIPPDSIVHRMRTGKYDFVYPDFE